MLDRTKHLSEHFTLGELTKTSFKTEDNNDPPLEAVENLIHLCEDWLEELRFNYNTIYVLSSIEDYYTSKEVEPLVINQGFRSYQVMLKMKEAGLNPSETSNHMKGCAVDIRCAGVEQAVRYMVIILDIADQKRQDFDELFLERKTIYTFLVLLVAALPCFGTKNHAERGRHSNQLCLLAALCSQTEGQQEEGWVYTEVN